MLKDDHLFFFFFFFLLLSLNSRYASLILVAASPLRFYINYHRSLLWRSASRMASSRLRYYSISEKCLRRLLSSSVALFNYF